ncbi:MAG: HD domain-containing protein [Lachnospiraceae bacterium]|nr:HD domain-containing protein [Lachnospiraceae bacterium]
MIAYYSVALILTSINLFIFIFQFEGKKANYYFTICGMLMTLDCIGYLSLALSQTLSEAVLANKICYLGGCFLPPVMLSAICAVCNYQLPTWIRNLIYSYSFFVYAMILTTGVNEFYYTEVYLDSFGDATVLGHTYGVGHIFFYINLYGHMIIQIIYLAYNLYKKYTVSRKNLWVLVMLEASNTVLFLLSRMLDSSFEIMPLTYVFNGWILIYLNRRIMMYNIEDSITSSLEKQESYGYIMFDNRKRYLGCNKLVRRLIPELAYCKVDYNVKNIAKAEVILDKIDNYAEEGDNEFDFETGERHYQCFLRRLWRKKKPCGYLVEMREDTDKWSYMKLLANYNSELEERVIEQTAHITDMQAKVLVGMANIVENRDNNTGGHIKRTSDVIEILLDTIQKEKILSLDMQFCKDIIKAAPMHDLGKIGIDDKILRKPGRLTDEEFVVMQTHAEKSAQLVESILQGVEEEHFVKVAINVARYHHEKWSGAGYPEHLKGEEIPLEARIMAIADVYDALVSKRCYKEPMSFEKAYEVMMESMGSHFDPGLKPVFVKSREKLEEYYKNT